jgi:hypothetical protein
MCYNKHIATKDCMNIPLTDEVKQVLVALEFKHTHHPADWEDTGGPESGPHLVGHNEYDEYSKGDTSVFVEGGIIVAVEKMPPDPEGFPF